ncbi:hypothetical protein LTR37_016371 [Vermiconidia calcicola]|uniref:Uncharacterized protein n=1 Tax=Vermiconidia calcicola TaxID=1690605 RepID=A0ACC3MPA1_9PEZI|nr:hypothetical protein LTR37_016371 [Vermiconidia calcicola]
MSFVVLLATALSFFFSIPANAQLLDELLPDLDIPVIGSILNTATRTLQLPSSPARAASRISSVVGSEPTDSTIFEVATNLVKAGLTLDNLQDAVDFVDGFVDGQDSSSNVNSRSPNPPVYPVSGKTDARYSLPAGAPQPIILVPGTGNTGYTTFKGNYIPLLQRSTIGDPVWLNIPDFLLDDAQVNAEFVAYAINYISGISRKRKAAVICWSQGNIDTQWAFKYWPSTRTRSRTFSPDYHSTTLANLIDNGDPMPPAVLQQEYNSDFITTLRANGGDSSYVPTTTVYSGFLDEIVQPQSGHGASAFLKNARGAGVSNNEVQVICPPGSPAGSFYTHEGTLYNPLGFALAIDALSHAGPGRPNRLDLDDVCAPLLTPGLDVTDFLLTENSILIAALTILTYPDRVLNEPPIKGIYHLQAYVHV